jgi:homocysteine S-methyltransferase
MSSLKDWFLGSAASDRANVLLLDGGVSTHLRDLCDNDPELQGEWYPELWSSSLLMTPQGRHVIVKGHKDWLAIGRSNIVTTVTYQVHCMSGIIDETKMKEMLQDGVRLAQQAVQEHHQESTTKTTDRPRYVVASMGCYGAALADGSEYTGLYGKTQSEQDLVDFHRIKTETLLQQKPDGIALETVPCVVEVRAFVELLRELQEQEPLPACWISLACRNGQELNDGSKLEEALQAVEELDPDASIIQAIGVNCCDSDHVPSLVRIIATILAAKPNNRRGIVIYPNSGEEWDANAKTWKEGTGLRTDDLQDVFANRMMQAVDIVNSTWKNENAGAQQKPPRIVVGGCCRTRPETIRALRHQVDKKERQPLDIQPPKKAAATKEPPPMTAEQERMMAQILGRAADFDHQLGDIGISLQDLAEIQQLQGEQVQKHTSVLKRADEK